MKPKANYFYRRMFQVVNQMLCIKYMYKLAMLFEKIIVILNYLKVRPMRGSKRIEIVMFYYLMFFLKMVFFRVVLSSQHNWEENTEILHMPFFPHMHSLLHYPLSHQSGTFIIIITESALTHHCHPKSIVKVH